MEKRKTAALFIELVIIAWTVASVALMSMGTGDDASLSSRNCFCYFTVDSNILSAAASLFTAVCLIRNRSSRAAAVLKFTGTVAVMVTFLTVLFFLGPVMGYKNMLSGHNLYLHAIGPLLAFLSCCLPEDEKTLSVKESLFGLIPVLAYGTFYYFKVIVFKTWPDFYGFAARVPWWVSYIAMTLAGLLISLAVRFIRNRRIKRLA